MNLAAFPTMLTIHLRTGYRALLAWVLALGATMVLITVSISGLYPTQSKIDTYADALGSGGALVALNGRVAGLHTLGGVVANEFGFLASFAVPLMGISLVARMTRKDEESGRLEMMLSGRIGRSAPIVAALLVAVGALVATAGALFAGLSLVGVPPGDAILYSASMAGLGFVFAGIAALVAQIVEHTRGVYGTGLAVLVVAYLLRGVGDVLENAVSWLSPLGWQEKTRAFGDDPRWWPLLVPLLVGLGLAAAAVVEAGRRDLGTALLHRGAGDAAASGFLRTQLGIAIRLHRGSIIGWAAGAAIVAATFGSLTQPLIEAIAGNKALGKAMGGNGDAGLDAVLAMTVLLLGLLCGAYVVQGIAMFRSEEDSGRLESQLSGSTSRRSWLGTHLLVVLAGLVIVAGLGGVALVAATAWSTGDDASAAPVEALVDYLPAVLVLGAVALLLFGLFPRFQPVAWLVYGVAALIAYLGEPLRLADPLLALSPFQMVGSPPQEDVQRATLLALSAAAVAIAAVAFAGFRRRGIPQG